MKHRLQEWAWKHLIIPELSGQINVVIRWWWRWICGCVSLIWPRLFTCNRISVVMWSHAPHSSADDRKRHAEKQKHQIELERTDINQQPVNAPSAWWYTNICVSSRWVWASNEEQLRWAGLSVPACGEDKSISVSVCVQNSRTEVFPKRVKTPVHHDQNDLERHKISPDRTWRRHEWAGNVWIHEDRRKKDVSAEFRVQSQRTIIIFIHKRNINTVYVCV